MRVKERNREELNAERQLKQKAHLEKEGGKKNT